MYMVHRFRGMLSMEGVRTACGSLWIIEIIESHSKMAVMHLYIWYGFNMYVTLLLNTFHPARNGYYSLQIYIFSFDTTTHS